MINFQLIKKEKFAGGCNKRRLQRDVIYKIAFTSFLFFAFVNFSYSATITSQTTNAGGDTLKQGLVGHWTFDGADVVSNVQDKSGAGNTGYMINMSTSTAKVGGVLGQGFNFDGVNDYVATVTSMSPSGSSRTVCTWFMTTKPSSVRQEIISTRGGNSGWAINIGQGNVANTLTYYHAGVATFSVSTPITTGVWYHVCVTYSASSLETIMYKNGVSIGQTTMSNDIVSLIMGKIGTGGCASGDCYLQGEIDDVRIYNRILTATEIKQIYNQGASKINTQTVNAGGDTLRRGLVGHWTFDGADLVSNVSDKSGSGYTGNMMNMSTSTAKVGGVLGQGLKFDGVNDYLTFGDVSLLENKSALTISFWVKFDIATNSSDQAIFTQYLNSANRTVRIFRVANGRFTSDIRLGSTNYTIQSNTGVLSNTKWNHLVLVYNGSNINEYLNSSSIAAIARRYQFFG
jgi:hypothetical protein